MKTLRTIIVDDEPLALDLIRAYLRDMPYIDLVAECQNGRQAVSEILALRPELVFMDIQMPGMTGLDVIRQLQSDIMPLIVFVTAYDEYAVDAFDVHAVDYLLKPFDQEQITRSVQRCFERMQGANEQNFKKEQYLNALQDALPNTNQHEAGFETIRTEGDPKLVIKDRGSITFVEQKDIDWVDAAGDYMCVHVSGQIHIMRSTLKNLLNQLNSNVFKRVHRSTIVNIKKVTQIMPLAKSEYFLVVNGDEKIKVSRNYKEVVRELISTLENQN